MTKVHDLVIWLYGLSGELSIRLRAQFAAEGTRELQTRLSLVDVLDCPKCVKTLVEYENTRRDIRRS